MNRHERRRAQAAARAYDARLERDRLSPKRAGRSDKRVVLGGSFETWKPGMVDLSSPDQVTLSGHTICAPGIGTDTRRIIERTTTRILAEHGARAFEAPKSSAAIHEAGHVCVHTVHGDRVTETSIRQHEGGGWLGYTQCPDSAFSCPGQSAAPEIQLKAARNLYAGLCAEQMFDPDFREGSSIDEWAMSQLFGMVAAQGLGANPETYWNREVHEHVVQVLRQHRAVVVDIANHLMHSHELSGRSLDELCARFEVQ
jgi:hypothetical protein